MSDEERQRVESLLAALGTSAEQVVATLMQFGIRGIPKDDCLCPVARYLSANGVFQPVVGPLWIEFEVEFGDDGIVGTPEAVTDFIQVFDRYTDHYPELVES